MQKRRAAICAGAILLLATIRTIGAIPPAVGYFAENLGSDGAEERPNAESSSRGSDSEESGDCAFEE